MSDIRVHHGDCLLVMRSLIDMGMTVDSVVCDPPYGIQFMGEEWDKLWRNQRRADTRFIEDNAGTLAARARKLPDYSDQVPPQQMQEWHRQWAALAFDLLKPGGYLLAFSATKTYHRLACGVEDAGFEIRDFISWLYGTGFPKSRDVSKAIDQHLGHERETTGLVRRAGKDRSIYGEFAGDSPVTVPASAEAAQWEGWGTALKPACEPVVFARKPMIGTVAENVLAHGTGGMHIDACRVPTSEAPKTIRRSAKPDRSDGYRMDAARATEGRYFENGRFPANVAHDGSAEVLGAFAAYGDDKGAFAPVRGTESSPSTSGIYGAFDGRIPGSFHGDGGTASRFFYSAKADKQDRWGSKHPTVKPIDLMRWLVRMVTPAAGTVLDPFAGSGSTGVACLAEGINALLIEKDDVFVADIRARINHYKGEDRHSVCAKNRHQTPTHDDLPLFGGAGTNG